MPIYEYKCLECDNKFEALRSMNQADKPIGCENCNGRQIKRVLSTFNSHGESRSASHSSGGCGSCGGGSCGSCGH